MLNKLIVDRYLDLPAFNQQAPETGEYFPADFILIPNRIYHIQESHYEGKIFRGRKRISQVSAGAHAAKVHRTFRWLPWIPGKVSCMALAGSDILTGEMTGCWLTIFRYNNTLYAGHIGTLRDPQTDESKRVREAWRKAVEDDDITPVRAFNPVGPSLGSLAKLNLQKQAPVFYGAFEANRNVYTVVLTAPGHAGIRKRIAKVVPMTRLAAVAVTAF